jgi:DNA repair protein RadC
VDATGLLGKRFYLQAFTARLSFFTLRSKILGIRVLDHIIFGQSDYFSFADAGLLS